MRDDICIGMRSYGWICKREYARFYLWEKATRSGKTIRECFYKQEIPVFNYSINDNQYNYSMQYASGTF